MLVFFLITSQLKLNFKSSPFIDKHLSSLLTFTVWMQRKKKLAASTSTPIPTSPISNANPFLQAYKKSKYLACYVWILKNLGPNWCLDLSRRCAQTDSLACKARTRTTCTTAAPICLYSTRTACLSVSSSSQTTLSSSSYLSHFKSTCASIHKKSSPTACQSSQILILKNISFNILYLFLIW